MKGGRAVFAPIPHSHTIEQHFSGGVEGHDFWLHQDFAILRHCTELCVLRLDGWKKSFGVAAEMAFARAHGIPITYIDP